MTVLSRYARRKVGKEERGTWSRNKIARENNKRVNAAKGRGRRRIAFILGKLFREITKEIKQTRASASAQHLPTKSTSITIAFVKEVLIILDVEHPRNELARTSLLTSGREKYIFAKGGDGRY